MPYRATREAVDGPIVQMRTPFSSRTSLVASRRSMKYSTPLPLVNTIQSKVDASSQARPSASASSGGAIWIVGAGIASAPRSSSISMSSPACSSDRVTTIRFPKSGRSSNQRRWSRSPATAPTTSIAASPSRAREAMSPSVPWMVSCDGSVPS